MLNFSKQASRLEQKITLVEELRTKLIADVVTGQVDVRDVKIPTYETDIIDFVADCRRGIEHSYDIVEGPMADDQIWNFVEGFIDGRIPRDAFWGLVRFNYPTHQIVFCTEAALKTLTFEGSEIL